MKGFVDVALTLLNNRFSVIPCGADKKCTLQTWKPYQSELMIETEARRCFANASRLAIIGGKVSGNLECLDIDDPTTYEPFLELLGMRSPGLPVKLLKRHTPSGGYHIIYRCSEPVAGNLKLACTSGNEVRIETRGEGGYFLSAPSEGYTVISGSMTNCPTLTPEEVEAIHSTAKAFDLRQAKDKPTTTTNQKNNGDSPGNRFNQAHSGTDILEAQGWKEDRPTTAGTGWTRPGKDSGTSGVLLENGNFYNFSANAYPLEVGESYTPFGLFTMYNHDGDFTAAARELAGVAPQGKSEEWPDPLPLTTHQESAQYPFHILPGTIGAAVREVIAFVQCPVALAACSALSAIATVGQGLVDVRRDEGLEGPTSLFVLAIADSGERKSTVDGHFTKPIRQWQADQKEAAKPEIQKHEAELAAWQAKRNGIVAAITAESKAGHDTSELEPNLIDLEKNKPVPPQVPVLLYGDATPEGLAFELVHKWPVGGVLSSEAGVVFGGHAMGKDSAMRNMSSLNSFWSGESIPVTRKGSPSFLLEGVRLSMGLAVQRETVRAFLDSSKGLARGIGFLARFLVAWPQSTQGHRLFKEQSKDRPALAAFHNRLLSLLNEPLSYDGNGALSPMMLELSPDAKAAWISFHDDVEVELLPGREMAETQDVASKAADNAVRLAALFHLFERAPGGQIGVDHMRAGATLAGWHLYEARRFMGEIALPIQKHHATKLDAWLLEYCKQNRVDEVSTRDAMRLGPNCTREKLILDSALEELIEACRIRIVKDGKKKTIKINPSLLRSDNGFA